MPKKSSRSERTTFLKSIISNALTKKNTSEEQKLALLNKILKDNKATNTGKINKLVSAEEIIKKYFNDFNDK